MRPRRPLLVRWLVVVLAIGAACSPPIAPSDGSPAARSSVPPGPSPSGAATNDALAFDAVARPFPANRESETAVAIDPISPNVVAAGINDLHDVRCDSRAPDPAPVDRPSDDDVAGRGAFAADETVGGEERIAGGGCQIVPGGGISGVAFSFDGGSTWHQPTYRTADGPRVAGLPRYRAAGMSPHGDPAVAFGPAPGSNAFSWSDGARLYYANIATRAPGREPPYPGRSAIAVSWTDAPRSAAAGHTQAWSRPAVASIGTGGSAFNDKEAIWADASATSRYFGRVYACWTVFGGPGLHVSIVASRSSDGGRTWAPAVALTTPATSPVHGGRQGCAIRTDSRGRVFVAWEDTPPGHLERSVHVIARSRDGGRTFGSPTVIARVHDVGRRDPFGGRTFDGAAGSRTNSFPSLDVAAGAPTGGSSADTLVVAWADGRGRSGERALVTLSNDGGRTWTPPVDAAEPGDRPSMPAVAIAPDGSRMWLVYDAFAREWRPGFDAPRPVRGVVRSSQVTASAVGPWTTQYRGPPGDARATSTTSLVHGTLYDYNAIAATTSGAVAVWNDARNARVCRAVVRYRARRDAGRDGGRPRVESRCPAAFGDTDGYAVALAAP